MLKLFLSSFFSHILISRSDRILKQIQEPIRKLSILNEKLEAQREKNIEREEETRRAFFNYKEKMQLRIVKAEALKDSKVAGFVNTNRAIKEQKAQNKKIAEKLTEIFGG